MLGADRAFQTVRNCEPAVPASAFETTHFQQVPTRVRRLLYEQVGRLAGQLQKSDAGVEVRLVAALVVGQGALDAVQVGAELGRAAVVVGRGDMPSSLSTYMASRRRWVWTCLATPSPVPAGVRTWARRPLHRPLGGLSALCRADPGRGPGASCRTQRGGVPPPIPADGVGHAARSPHIISTA